LRQETAWVDPTVQIWNRSLRDNLCYGTYGEEKSFKTIIEQADLLEILEKLPDAEQTSLGEGGGLVSGGEGQRVRLGRAMLRPDVKLVILDEPFRGLDRDKRRLLLARARHYWEEATLIFISHDVGDTQTFKRVLVVEEGRIVEDDSPAVLLAQPESRYYTLLAAEKAVRQELWEGEEWRHLWMEKGQLREL
jgi:ATP-binding cassette subfamily B protein